MEKYTILDKKNSITIDKHGIKKYKYLVILINNYIFVNIILTQATN